MALLRIAGLAAVVAGVPQPYGPEHRSCHNKTKGLGVVDGEPVCRRADDETRVVATRRPPRFVLVRRGRPVIRASIVGRRAGGDAASFARPRVDRLTARLDRRHRPRKRAGL